MDLKYSLVVSIYGVEKYLTKCIDSIINQSYKNLEIILVDDGSIDGSGAICDSYALKDYRVKVIHKKNEGLGKARNTGLAYASGDYILFIDGDDFLDLSLIEICNNYLKKEKYDIISYDFKKYYNDDNLEKEQPNRGIKVYRQKSILSEILPKMIYDISGDSCINGSAWSKAYSLKFLRTNRFKFVSEREYISEDLYTNLYLFSYVNTLAIIPNKLYYYRQNNNNSLTRTYKKDRLDKNNYQYYEAIKLANQLGYSYKIKNNLAFQYLANIFGLFDTILNCKTLDKKEKKKEILNIISNSDFNYIVNQLQLTYEPIYKKVIIFCFKHKLKYVSYVLLKIRNKFRRRQISNNKNS